MKFAECNEEDEVWTAEFVAKLMRISPKTLANRRSKGEGPPFCADGRLVWYIPTAVRAWFEGRLVMSPAEARKRDGTRPRRRRTPQRQQSEPKK